VWFASILVIRRGGKYAKFFFLGWSFYLLGQATFNLRNLGFLPFTFVTNYGVQIGSCLEIIIFSIALNFRMRESQIEELKAKAKTGKM